MSNNEKQAYREQVVRFYKKAKKQLNTNSLNSNYGSNFSPFTFHQTNAQNNNPFNLFSNSLINSNNIFNRMLNHIHQYEQNEQIVDHLGNQNQNQSMSQSKSYSERTLPDGSKIVTEVTKTNNNGQINQVIKTHKVMPDGTVQQIVSQ